MIDKINSLISKVNNSDHLKEQLDMFSDVIFLDEPDFSFADDLDQPETDWSVERVCTFAENGSGGRFYLLADGTIGFESSEGQSGRIAENIDDFLMLIVYCPYWMDLCGARSLMYLEDRQGFVAETEKESIEFFADYSEVQKGIARALKLTPPTSSFDVSEKFHAAVAREPGFFGVCHEDGSDETWETERLFEE